MSLESKDRNHPFYNKPILPPAIATVHKLIIFICQIFYILVMKAKQTSHNNIYLVAFVVIVIIVVAVIVLENQNYLDSQAQFSRASAPSSITSADVDTVSTGIGNTLPVSGNHYNLNIIGTDNVGAVGDSQGHTMFVLLNGKTKVLMTQDLNGEFKVTDRDGTDGSASFNIAPGKYNIYARALGKPGGNTKIDAWGEFTDAQDGTSLQLIGYVDITRTKGTSKWVNINSLFYADVTLCVEVNDLGECVKKVVYDDYWIFELLNYWWEYNNKGLKLLQVRFYECTLDPTGTKENYCRWGDGSPIVSKKTFIDI